MDLTKIEGIVFDMDGVIFDSEKIGMRCWKTLAEKYNLGDITATAMKCIGRSTVDTMKIFENAYGHIVNIEQLYHESKLLFREIVEEEGMPLKDGARELLDFLDGMPFKVGLASSTTYSTVVEQLKMVDLFKHFRVIVGGNMIERSKPEPEIYLLACKQLGINPVNSIAIEDSRNGIISAHRAGMKTFLVPDLIEPDEEILSMATEKFSNLLEIKETLSALSDENKY